MNTLDIIKHTYVDQLISLNYDFNSTYPNSWNKEEFKSSIENIDSSNKKILVEQYIDAILKGLNIYELEQNAYHNSLEKLSGLNINTIELEQILNQYIMEHPNVNLLDPHTNPLNNKQFREKLEMLQTGYSSGFSSNIPSVSVNMARPVPVNRSRADANTSRADADTSRADANQARRDAVAAREDVNVAHRELADERANVARARREADDANARANVAEAAAAARAADVDGRIAAIAARAAAAEADAVTARGEAARVAARAAAAAEGDAVAARGEAARVADIDGRMAAAAARVNAAEADAVAARGEAARAIADIAATNDRVAEVAARAEAARREADEANARIAAAEAAAADALRRVGEITERADAANASAAAATARADAATASADAATASAVAATARADAATANAAAANTRADESNARAAVAEAAVARAEANVNARIEAAVAAATRVADTRVAAEADTKNAAAAAAHASATDALTKANQDRDNALAQLAESRQSLTEARKLLKSKQERITILSAEKDDLSRRLKDLSNKGDGIKDALAKLREQNGLIDQACAIIDQLTDQINKNPDLSEDEKREYLAQLDDFKRQIRRKERVSKMQIKNIEQLRGVNTGLLAELLALKDTLEGILSAGEFANANAKAAAEEVIATEARLREVEDLLAQEKAENKKLRAVRDLGILELRENKEESDAQIRDLTDRLANSISKEEADDLRRKLAAAESEKARIMAVIAGQIKDEKAAALAALEATRAEAAASKDALNKSKQSEDVLNGRIAALESQLAALKLYLPQIEDLTKKLKIEEDAKKVAEKALADSAPVTDETRKALSAANGRIAALESQLEALKLYLPQIQQLERKLKDEQAAKAEVDAALAKAVAAHAVSEAEFHNAKAAIQAELDHLGEDYRAKETELGKLKSQLDELLPKLELARKSAADANTIKNRILDDKKELERVNRQNDAEIKRLNGALLAATGLYDKEKIEHERYQRLFDETSLKLDRLQENFELTGNKLKAIEEELDALKKTLENKDKELVENIELKDNILVGLKAKEKELEEKEKELDKMKRQLQAQQDLSKLDLADTSEEADTLREEIIKGLKGEADAQLKKELEEASKKCEEEKGELAAELKKLLDAEKAKKESAIAAAVAAEKARGDALRNALLGQNARDIAEARAAKETAEAAAAAARRAAASAGDDARRAAAADARRVAAAAAEADEAAARRAPSPPKLTKLAQIEAENVRISNLIDGAIENRGRGKEHADENKASFKDFFASEGFDEKQQIDILKEIIVQLQISVKDTHFVEKIISADPIKLLDKKDQHEVKIIDNIASFWNDALDTSYIYHIDLYTKYTNVLNLANKDNVKNHKVMQEIIASEGEVDHNFVIDLLLFFIDYITVEFDISKNEIINVNTAVKQRLQTFGATTAGKISNFEKKFINYIVTTKDNMGITPLINIKLPAGYNRLMKDISLSRVYGRLRFILNGPRNANPSVDDFNAMLMKYLEKHPDKKDADASLLDNGIWSNKDDLSSVKEDLDAMRDIISVGGNPITQKGGSSNNKMKLLEDVVSAYIMLRSPVYNKSNKVQTIKDMISSSIKSSIKLKDNKVVKVKIPLINDLLKMVFLPLFCENKGIKVTYENMFKCYKKNIHTLLSSKEITKFLELFNLSKEQKDMFRQYDRRVSSIMKLI
jgi:chromosome segregation ATPase